MRGDEIVWSIWLVIWTWLWQDWVRLHGGYFLIWNKSFCFFVWSTILQVDFYPEGRGYSGVFSGRDNYYPRDDYFYGGGYRYILLTHHPSTDFFFLVNFGKNEVLQTCPFSEPPQCRHLRTKLYLKVMLPKTQRKEKARIDQADHCIGREDVEKKKLTIAFTTTTWFLISTYSTLRPDFQSQSLPAI